MAEVGAEFDDPQDESNLHTMDKLICTLQGNPETVAMVIELIGTRLDLIKCHKRECKWMQKDIGVES